MIDAANMNMKYRIVKDVSDILSLQKMVLGISFVPGASFTTRLAAARSVHAGCILHSHPTLSASGYF
jgi:hypothetical protein